MHNFRAAAELAEWHELYRKLFGAPAITGPARSLEQDGWDGALYRSGVRAAGRKVRLVAVPYCLWVHRKAGEMRVWLREAGARPQASPNTSRSSSRIERTVKSAPAS